MGVSPNEKSNCEKNPLDSEDQTLKQTIRVPKGIPNFVP